MDKSALCVTISTTSQGYAGVVTVNQNIHEIEQSNTVSDHSAEESQDLAIY